MVLKLWAIITKGIIWAYPGGNGVIYIFLFLSPGSGFGNLSEKG